MNNTQLKRAIIDALDAAMDVDVSHIGVIVEQGVVTLTGHVRSYADIARAEEIVRAVPGVHAIAQEIEVKAVHTEYHDDEAIAADILRRIERDVRLPVHRLQLRVRDAWVTVAGSLDTLQQRDALAQALVAVPGVQGVVNQVAVLPIPDVSAIRDVIADCLHRQADVDASNIDIRVHDGVVTLSCDVEHMDQVSAARDAVRQVEGIREVVVEFRLEADTPH